MIPDCSLCKAGDECFGLYQEKSTDTGGKVIYLFGVSEVLSCVPYWLSRWDNQDWSYLEETSILVPGQLI